MINPILLPEIREMLALGDEPGMRDLLTQLHPATVAEFSEGLTDDEIWTLLQRAELPRQAEILSYFDPQRQIELVQHGDRARVAAVLAVMPSDNQAKLLKRLDSEVVEGLLPLVAKVERQEIRRMLAYPEHSAGSIMTTEYAWLPPDVTAGEALRLIRDQAPETETIYYLYVLDKNRTLLGFVSLSDLILAKSGTQISDLMRPDVIKVGVNLDQEEVARMLARYDFLALPVTDDNNRLVGIVTHDDVIDVVVSEATEDAQRQGAVEPLEEDYLHAKFTSVWRKRAVWLSCLFVAELFTFTALAYFEDAIAAILVLSLFVPLCISTGGNSGSQAATLITRAMALGQLGPRDWFHVMRHELAMGIALGITLGLIAFARAMMTPQSVLGSADRWLLALTVSQAVAIICLWGSLVGAMLPLAFQRIGFDPGYASSPFVATFVDVTGIIIYFTIAQVYLM